MVLIPLTLVVALALQSWPAVMVTDTAPFRNPHYHQPSDPVDTLDFSAVARVVDGVAGVVRTFDMELD